MRRVNDCKAAVEASVRRVFSSAKMNPSESKPWYRVRVPASSANLGPGFDALGLALGVYLTCRFRHSKALSITTAGRDACGIPANPDNLIWQTALTVARNQRMAMPPIELEIHNEIPLGKGMGSSA